MSRPETHDVIVIGSGGAGLVAALTAAVAGLETLLIEKSDLLGGTTAISGAGVWIPANSLARAARIADSPKDALAYIRACAPPGWQAEEDPLWESFVAEAPRMLDFVTAHSPLRFALSDDPDPYPEHPGARRTGRMVSPLPLPGRIAGPFAHRIRHPNIPHVLTYQETRRLDPWHHPVRAVLRRLPSFAWRAATGRRAQGTALVTGLVAGFLRAGGRIATGTAATSLIPDEHGAITGLDVETSGETRRLAARLGLVLASGGFEWDAMRRARHFPGPLDLIASPPTNTGDSHTMAEAIGARLAHMDQANIAPAIPAMFDGAPQPLATFHHRDPGAILVGSDGKRFVNEYLFNLGEVLLARDPDTGAQRHLPAWLIGDHDLLRRSPVLAHFLRRARDWTVEAESIEALAARINLPARILTATVVRFNSAARTGVDAEFGRHLDPLGRDGLARDRLRQITRPPFVAIPFNLTFLSTKGGPRTNSHGQVLHTQGHVIPGLYCAGVAMANPFGTRAVGSGTTIGPNMTWGWICARDIITRQTSGDVTHAR